MEGKGKWYGGGWGCVCVCARERERERERDEEMGMEEMWVKVVKRENKSATSARRGDVG